MRVGLFFVMDFAVHVLCGGMDVPYIVGASVGHLLFIGLVLVVLRGEFWERVFTATVFIVAKTLIWNFCSSLFSCFVLTAKRLMTNGEEVWIGSQGDIRISRLAYCAAFAAILLLKGRLGMVLQDKVKSWYRVLTVPLLFVVFLFDMVNWGASNGILVVANASGAEVDGFYNQIFSHIGICLLAVLSMCISAGLVFGGNRVYVEQRQKERFASQIAYYKMLQEQFVHMERLRHDMKNHVLALYGLWNSKEYGKAGRYLEKMLENGNIASAEEATGSKAVDALLFDKCRRAEKMGVAWECDVRIPKGCVMDEFDLCVILGNVLDNALKACGKIEARERAFVRIVSKCVKNCLLIVAANATHMRDLKEMERGTGLANIQGAVERYNGVVQMKAADFCFEISILIPMKQNGYDGEKAVYNDML